MSPPSPTAGPRSEHWEEAENMQCSIQGETALHHLWKSQPFTEKYYNLLSFTGKCLLEGFRGRQHQVRDPAKFFCTYYSHRIKFSKHKQNTKKRFEKMLLFLCCCQIYLEGGSGQALLIGFEGLWSDKSVFWPNTIRTLRCCIRLFDTLYYRTRGPFEDFLAFWSSFLPSGVPFGSLRHTIRHFGPLRSLMAFRGPFWSFDVFMRDLSCNSIWMVDGSFLAAF